VDAALERSGAALCQTYRHRAPANIFAGMGKLLSFVDRLTNVMSGQGTTVDRRTAATYVFNLMTPEQAEAAYRTSWLVKKIVDIPAKDMTREWRDWQAEGDQIELLEKEEKRLQLRAKVQRALILSRLYGGGALYLSTGDKNPDQPLDLEKIKKGGLKFVHVLAPRVLSIGQEILDPESPDHGQPEYYQLSAGHGRSMARIHPSRIVPFIGQRAPEGSYYQQMSWFWGDPIMQSIGDAIRNADNAQDGFASLIDEAKIDILRMPGLTDQAQTAEGEQRILNRLAATALGKSTWRAMLLDKEDEWEQRQVTWTGIPEAMHAFLNVVAGAADIPVTRLLGQSPKGLQSTGEGEERDYHAMVKANQDDQLAPALDRIDELLIRSALGTRPEEIHYTFAPLSELSEKEASEIDKRTADTLKVYVDTGLIHEEALAEIARNKMTESGRFPGCEAAFDNVKNALATPEPDPVAEAAALNAANENEAKANVKALKQNGTITAKQADSLLEQIRDRFNPNQPRAPKGSPNGGMWIRAGAGVERISETDENRPPEPGKPFLVFRAAHSSETDLVNKNAGNSVAVGVHLARLDDWESGRYVGQSMEGGKSLTIHAYKVTLDKPVGKYDYLNSGVAGSIGNASEGASDVVGFNPEGISHNFSFRASGYQAEHLASFPASHLLQRLKAKAQASGEYAYDDFDGWGGIATGNEMKAVLAERIATGEALERIWKEGLKLNVDPLMGDAYNPNQPRDPGGEGGGQWVSGGAGSAAFADWFGNSKVVDENGKPLIVYHGSTSRDVEAFDPTRVTARGRGDEAGVYFTPDSRVASYYARASDGQRGKVYAAYLRLENPLDTTKAIASFQKKGMSFGDAKREALKALDRSVHDGIIFRGDKVNTAEYVAFNSTQIKAVDNAGTFDPSNPRIFDRYDPNQPRDPGGEGGGQWVAAGGSGEANREGKPHPSVEETLSEEQLAALRNAIANGGSEEILAAMQPVYQAAEALDIPETLKLNDDGTIPDGFFEGRRYNLPDGTTTDFEGAIRHLVNDAKSFAGANGPGADGRAIMLLGPPAAGKSMLAEKLALSDGFAIVDPDEAKKIIPEYDNGKGTGAVHEESSAISKIVQAQLQADGINVIIPTVSSGPSSSSAKMQRLQTAGYKVELMMMEVDQDVFAKRMANRYIKTGRYVPEAIVRTGAATSSGSYEALKEQATGYAKITNNGKPKVIESTVEWASTGKPFL
jgi:phage-related protein (TIGR01555 family)